MRRDSTAQLGWKLVVKRVADRALGAFLLITLSPLLAATALAVRRSVGRPVIFTQERLGRASVPFHILKFRTMREARGDDGSQLPDEARLTSVGRLLRSYSLDELPELINVVRGEMSLVGPRPLLPEYAAVYTPEQNRRHEVLPGITGWAQINGRNALAWDRRLDLDLWYVDNWSLTLDGRILLRTALRVIRRDGITFSGHATSPRLDDSARSTEDVG